jgi:hypothetical protein
VSESSIDLVERLRCMRLGPCNDAADRIEQLEREKAEMLETLQGIRDANWRDWEELASPHEFVRWAQARANQAVTRYATSTPDQPPEAPKQGEPK